MAQNIKIIWDLRGPDSKPMAEHHVIHLKEYIEREKLELIEAGVEEISGMHCLAYMVIPENNMIQVRDALKPHRSEMFQP